MKYMEPLEIGILRSAVFVTGSPLGSRVLVPLGLDEAAEPAVMIEEWSGRDLAGLTRRTNLRLGLAIALGMVIIGLGVAGRIAMPPPVGIASIGSLVPPSHDLIAAPMPPAIVAPAPLYPQAEEASQADVALAFEVSSTTQAGSTSVRLRQSAAAVGSEGLVALLVDGHAPSDVASFTIDIRTLSGSLIASAVVPTMGDERPGPNGLPRGGIRSIAWQLAVPRPVPADDWRVEITWRDGSNGTSGSVSQRMTNDRAVTQTHHVVL